MYDYCFPSMHMASGDRFVLFKAGEDRRNNSFFFYRVGYRTGGTEERPNKKKSGTKKIVLVLVARGSVVSYGEFAFSTSQP